jgi:tetratricopeptide (TPR) repeat protein
MKQRAWFFLILIFLIAPLGPQNAAAQVHRSRLEQGVGLYRGGYWTDAVLELRRSRMEAANAGQLAESLYWLSLAEFSLGEYDAALRDIGELQRIAPAGLRIDDILYYKGRSLYYVNRHEEALTVFRLYAALLERSKIDTPQARVQKTTLTYWIGECLYSLGRQDQAAELFAQVLNARPRIEKYEAASYRLGMIRQNKLQAEILGMLDWSYSEYLRMVGEYQTREAAYNETIAAYRQQVDGILADAAHKAGLEELVMEYQRLLNSAEERIRILEVRVSEAKKAVQGVPAPPLAPGQEDALWRVRELKAEAERIRNGL